MNKRYIIAALAASLVLSGCASKSGSNTQTPDSQPEESISYITIKDADTDTSYDDSAYTAEFSDGSVTCSSSDVTISGTVLTITEAGTYVISGSSDDGQIIIDTDDDSKVHLVFKGISLTCENSAPVYVRNADKVIITLADNTENYMSDGEQFIYDDEESSDPNAVIFSKDDLSINGNGSLTVSAGLNNGISCSDDLKIVGGNITVTAVNTAIRGKDSLTIQNAVITATSDDNALKSTNTEDANKGYIHIISGTLNITAKDDGLHAETDIKIESGNLTLNCEDDAIHSNGDITIDDGNIVIDAGDDGIHADGYLVVNNGSITVNKSYEGLEGNVITINDGSINITSSDDGLNAAGESSSDNPMAADNSCVIYINGGTIYVNADGDGLDSNGSIIMENGVVAIDGPSSNANGALDCGSTITVNGGYLFAVGSSGMAESISDSSSQNSALICLDGSVNAGLVTVADGDGNVILSFNAAKSFNAINISCPELTIDSTYTIYSGGTVSDGKELMTDLVTGGTIKDGTSLTNYTQSQVSVSNGRGGFGPGGNNDFGGGNGGNGGNAPDNSNGNPPETPDASDGSRPDMPDNSNGSRPEMPDDSNGNPPEKPDNSNNNSNL